jgi:hypothetical protein
VQLAVSVVSVPTPDGGTFNGLCSKSGGRDPQHRNFATLQLRNFATHCSKTGGA